MACFTTTAPDPGTPQYEEWFHRIEPLAAKFKHVVDYYYGQAGFAMPRPQAIDNARGWLCDSELPSDLREPVDLAKNEQVLRQIFLHIDCDGVSVFDLNDVGRFLNLERTPERLGYGFVQMYCFVGLRNKN
jgi:hypothetical protein